MSESPDEERGRWPICELPRGWEWVTFFDFFYDKTDSRKKLPQKDYLPEGSIAVVDQGIGQVGGYTDKSHLISDVNLPAIVWGDHTRVVKFITFLFVQGADGVKVFQPSELVESKFGYYALLSVEIPNKGYSRHFKFLKRTLFPLPPLNEQRRIADRIDTLQAGSRRAREALAEAQTLLEQFRQSVLSAAFRGALTAKWREEHPDAEPASELLKRIRSERRQRWEKGELAKYTAKGKTPPPGWQKKYPEPVQVDTADLPELPQGWCWASLDELSWASGYGKSEKCSYDGTGEPVLRIPNVINNKISTSDLKYALNPLHLESGENLDIGDMLIIRTNGSLDLVGRCAVVQEKMNDTFYFASYLIRFRLLLPELLSTWISSLWDSLEIRNKIVGLAVSAAGQNNINMTKLAAMPIPIASEQELRHLGTLLPASLSRCSYLRTQGDEMDTQLTHLNQSILAKAFRGKLVPQNPDDEPASKLLERIQSEKQGSDYAKPPGGRRKAKS